MNNEEKLGRPSDDDFYLTFLDNACILDILSLLEFTGDFL